MSKFSTATTGQTPTLASIERAAALLADLGPEPIGEWMREQGFPPESSMLVLPQKMQADLGPFPPHYVRFSPHIDAPVLTRDAMSLDVWEGWRL